jgi:hypothetical protein
MNKVMSFVKQYRLGQLVVVFFAGIVLLLSTACTPRTDMQAKIPAPNSSGTGGTYNERVGQQTELYDPIQERKGGMNEYSDVDPRVNKKGVNAKATGLVKNAEDNVDRVQNPKEFAEDYRQGTPVGERTRNIVDRVTDATQNTAEDVAKGTQRGVENLKDNARTTGREFSKGAQRVGQDTADSAKDKAGQAVRSTQEGVNKATESLNRNRA